MECNSNIAKKRISIEYPLGILYNPIKLMAGRNMNKTVQMSLKLEPDLRDSFIAVSELLHTPAAQILRQLMRKFISEHKTPNTSTIEAMQSADRKEGKRFKSANDLFDDLGI